MSLRELIERRDTAHGPLAALLEMDKRPSSRKRVARARLRPEFRPYDHVTLTRDAAAFAVATSTLAVLSCPPSKLQPHNALGNLC